MAKPIKKNKARFSGSMNFRQVGSFVVGILLFVAIIFGVYWFYHHNEATKKTTDQSVATIMQSFNQNGLKSTGVLVLAVGGTLFAFIFNKK